MANTFKIDPGWRKKVAALKRRAKLLELLLVVEVNDWTEGSDTGGASIAACNAAEKAKRAALISLWRMMLTAREKKWVEKFGLGHRLIEIEGARP